MSEILEIPDPVFAKLKKAAAASGLTPVDWIDAQLGDDLATEGDDVPVPPQTLAERFAGRFGRIASNGQERLSEDTGERFADYVESKRREGRL